MDFVIVDKEGKWLVNPHAFRFVDPTTKQVFQPGVPVKLTYAKDGWVALQLAAGVLAEAGDPLAEPETAEQAEARLKAEAEAEAEAKAKAEAEAKAKAEAEAKAKAEAEAKLKPPAAKA